MDKAIMATFLGVIVFSVYMFRLVCKGDDDE